MGKRRGNGEGAVGERPDGRWQGRITLGYDDQGRQKRRYVYGRTQREVLDKLDELRRQHALGVLSDSRLKVDEYLKQWRSEKAKTIKPRTVEIYEGLAKHVKPHMGGKRLDKVKPLDVQACIGAIAEDVGTPTANKARRMLFGAFKQAVKWQMIARNPVEAVDPLREEARPMRIWSSVEAARFIDHAQAHRLFPAVYLMMATGLRRGEALGLEWSDLEGNRLHVQRSLTTLRGKPAWSTPKTSRGVRTITVPDDALQILAQHKRRQEAERAEASEAWEHPRLVFTNEVGGIVTPIAFTHHWNRMQTAAGVTHVRLHDLRHLHVSLLVREGFDPRTIADRIGHADPAFTLRRYSHMFEEQRAAAAVNLTQLLRRSTPGGN